MGNASKKEKKCKEKKEIITCWNDDSIERHSFITIDRELLCNTSGRRYFDMKFVYQKQQNNIMIIARMIETDAVGMCEWSIQTYLRIFNLNIDENKIKHICDTEKQLYQANHKNCFQTNFTTTNENKCFIKISNTTIAEFDILNQNVLNDTLALSKTKTIIGFIDYDTFVLVHIVNEKGLHIIDSRTSQTIFEINDHDYSETKSVVMDSNINVNTNVMLLADTNSFIHFYDIGPCKKLCMDNKENGIAELLSYQTISIDGQIRCVKFNAFGNLLAIVSHDIESYDEQTQFFYSVYMLSESTKTWHELFTETIRTDDEKWFYGNHTNSEEID